jgi:hypothetical protein
MGTNMGLTAEQAEALFNLANNGVLTRIDERGQRCRTTSCKRIWWAALTTIRY